MKNIKKCLVINITIILFFSGMIVGAADECNPCISLPEDPVTLLVEDGVNSYFDTYLSNVPSGYDVIDGVYPGWCADTSVAMPRGVSISVTLYCSYDPDMPDSFKDDDWDKINYVLNNKPACSVMYDIQHVIWYYLEDRPTSRTCALAIISDADLNGDGFCPEHGDVIAILADGDASIQRSFFEVPIPYEGLTPGFWKNHKNDWVGHSTSNTIGSVFDVPSELSKLASKTFIKALKFGGGNTIEAAAKLLLKQAVAALLNAGHPNVNYPILETEIIYQVNNALASLDRDAMLSLKDTLDNYNNLSDDL